MPQRQRNEVQKGVSPKKDSQEKNSQERIAAIERRIGELTAELGALRKASVGEPTPNYPFETLAGRTTLKDLFVDQERLLVIHNMGQGCRYCTLWADGFNGLLPHLESALAVVMVSKDPPETQRRFANSRGWRFRLASHRGGAYIREQGVFGEGRELPRRGGVPARWRAHPAQERLRLRSGGPVLRIVAAARHGWPRRWRLDAAVPLLATAGAARRRRRRPVGVAWP